MLELLFQCLALGDVVDGADHLRRLPALVADDLRPAVHHPDLAVGPYHAVFEVVGSAVV